MSILSLGQQVWPKWVLPWKTRDLGKQPAEQPVQGHQNQLVVRHLNPVKRRLDQWEGKQGIQP